MDALRLHYLSEIGWSIPDPDREEMKNRLQNLREEIDAKWNDYMRQIEIFGEIKFK